jgi:two-component system, cell cycle response regulator
MQRRFSYALIAGLLSSSLPDRVAGRPAIRWVRPAIFAAFGYVLGRQADALAELSETDSLTRLLNARGFAARLHAEIQRSRRYREPLSLLFLDLDGLKAINDRHGHRAGSQALRDVAGVIRAKLRDTDTGARWGGDEFTVIAPNTSKDSATLFAERIRAGIAADVTDWPLTASIGIATLDWAEAQAETMPDAQALLRDADAAMYEAKRRGKNNVVANVIVGRPDDQEQVSAYS